MATGNTCMRRALIAAVCLAVVLWACPGLSDDVDPGGKRLKSVVEAALEHAPANDLNAHKVRMSSKTDMMHPDLARTFCLFEVGPATFGIGHAIWSARLGQDECWDDPATDPEAVVEYCIRHSVRCGHWRWNGGCFCPTP